MYSGPWFLQHWLSDVSMMSEIEPVSRERVVPTNSVVVDALPEKHILIFTLAYIAMVPCANLVGFAGQELARKFPHVFGVLAEITYAQSTSL
jgi:hypothetical protein